MTLSTQYWVYVHEWSQETCAETLAYHRDMEDRLRRFSELSEAERTGFDWGPRYPYGQHGPRDPRIDYYEDRRHMHGVKSEHWDEFAAWCAAKGYHVYQGMPLYQSMTMYAP